MREIDRKLKTGWMGIRAESYERDRQERVGERWG